MNEEIIKAGEFFLSTNIKSFVQVNVEATGVGQATVAGLAHLPFPPYLPPVQRLEKIHTWFLDSFLAEGGRVTR